jgi:hypothetical protein
MMVPRYGATQILHHLNIVYDDSDLEYVESTIRAFVRSALEDAAEVVERMTETSHGGDIAMVIRGMKHKRPGEP